MERYAVTSSTQTERRRLEAAGFEPAQVEALLQMIGDTKEALATKQDVAAAQGALTQDIAEVRDCFESFRQEIAGQMDGLRGEMRAIKWMIGGILAMMAPMASGVIALALR